MQIEQNFFYRSRWITSSEVSTILHIIRKPNSITALLFIKNILSSYGGCLLIDVLRNFCLFLGTVSGYPLEKVDNIHGAIFFVFSFISSVQSSEIQLFRLRIAVEAIFCSSLVNKQLCRSSWKEAKQPRFHANIPSINLVCQQIYCRIDGILLASSKFGPGQKKKKKTNAQQHRFRRPTK